MKSSGFVKASGLPENPLDAAAEFHFRVVPSIRETMGSSRDIVVVFDPADHSHGGWRLAAIQELAREAVPCRINAVVCSRDNLEGTAQAIQFVHDAPGVTGQILQVDGNPAKSA